MNLDNLKICLGIYGSVDQCEVVNDRMHVKITGFHNGAMLTYQAAKYVIDATNNEWPMVDKVEVDEGIFHLILRKKA